MFTEGLYALLVADAGMQAVLGTPATRTNSDTGVYPNNAPDECQLPYLVYSQVHRDPIESFQGINRVHTLRFQVSCYGNPYPKAKLLAVAVKNLLDGFQGALPGGVYVQYAKPVSEHDETEPVFKATVYGVILDYEFICNG